MAYEHEASQIARLDPAVVALHLEAKGWQRQQGGTQGPFLWSSPSDDRVLYQVARSLPEIEYTSHTGHLLYELAEIEERSPQALLWDLQAIPYARLRLICSPRLQAESGAPLVALSSLLQALHQGLRQAALQVERSGYPSAFQAQAFLPTVQVLPQETTDYDLMVGSSDPAAGPVWSEFLALLGRPATPITTRRELEPGELHLVLEPLRQAMKAAGITELAGQYLQAGEPNVPGLGLHFRIDAAGTLLMGGDD